MFTLVKIKIKYFNPGWEKTFSSKNALSSDQMEFDDSGHYQILNFDNFSVTLENNLHALSINLYFCIFSIGSSPISILVECLDNFILIYRRVARGRSLTDTSPFPHFVCSTSTEWRSYRGETSQSIQLTPAITSCLWSDRVKVTSLGFSLSILDHMILLLIFISFWCS